MREIKTTFYLFSELSEDAKQAAVRKYLESSGFEYFWQDENKESIQAFVDHFSVKIEWSVCTYKGIDYKHNADNSTFRGLKLREFNRKHMPTGYCLDCDLWHTFYDEWQSTGSALKAFDAAIYAGLKAIKDDMEYQETEECIGDYFMINEYEFTKDGTMI